MDYLQPQTLGTILKNAAQIYWRNWLVLLGLLSPVFPILFLQRFAGGEGSEGAFFLFSIAFYPAVFLSSFPVAIAISDICIGLKPSIGGSVKRAFKHPGSVIATILMVFAILLLGMILLVIPGLVFSVWYMFVGSIVVIESTSGRAALRRSKDLGKGFYWRNFGVGVLAQVTVMLVASILGGVAGAIVYMVGGSAVTAMVLGAIIGTIFAPFSSAVTVLLYYDMRARKESFGATQLAEELSYRA